MCKEGRKCKVHPDSYVLCIVNPILIKWMILFLEESLKHPRTLAMISTRVIVMKRRLGQDRAFLILGSTKSILDLTWALEINQDISEQVESALAGYLRK
jgi:hypothetical protein